MLQIDSSYLPPGFPDGLKRVCQRLVVRAKPQAIRIQRRLSTLDHRGCHRKQAERDRGANRDRGFVREFNQLVHGKGQCFVSLVSLCIV